jgi:hypothetical protein
MVPVVVMAIVVGLGGGAAYLLTRPQPSASEHEPAPKAEPTLPPEPAKKPPEFVPPAEVTVEIISSPEGAMVWVSGEEASRGATPTKLTLPRSTAPLDVVLKAPGYLDKQLSLDTSRDRTMSVLLQARENARPRASEPNKSIDKSGTKKVPKSLGKSSGGREPASTFKPVGD